MTKQSNSKINDLGSIGKRIAEKRTAKGISQKQLSEKVHVSQSIIAKIEKGERNIQNDLLIMLADELNTNTDYLLRGIDTQNINVVDDLHLNNEAVNCLRNFLESDWIMEIDGAKDAVNFFLSSRNGFSIISQIYAYLFSDCSFVLDGKKRQYQTDSLRIPLNKDSMKENVTVSYHLSSENFSDMILQRIMFNIKQWRNDLNQTLSGDKDKGVC